MCIIQQHHAELLGIGRFPTVLAMRLKASGRRSARRAALGSRANECRGSSVSATSTHLAAHRGPVAPGRHVQNIRNHAKCLGGMRFPAYPGDDAKGFWAEICSAGRIGLPSAHMPRESCFRHQYTPGRSQGTSGSRAACAEYKKSCKMLRIHEIPIIPWRCF